MDLIAQLLADPRRFEFVQAVRLLLLALGERGIPPRQALGQHLRFANSLSLQFPASQLEAVAEGAASVFHLTPTFMGLLGVHGTMPLHVTERMQAWLAQDAADSADSVGGADEHAAARAFLDMFSTRMLALWYGAWRKYRVEHMVAAPQDAFMPLLLALAGFRPGAGAGRDGVADVALAAHAGVLRRRPASAAVLGRVLSSHFGVSVLVQEGIGHWNRLAPDEQSALGGANAQLGRAALLGARSWRPDLRVRVRIGPLDRRQFERFLPHGAGARALRTLLGLFAAPTLAYDIVLVLRRRATGPVQLGGAARRLGLDSYLLHGQAASDRADMHYEVRPLAPLASLPPPLPPPRK
jgi:type VI secretion system protein ImpH